MDAFRVLEPGPLTTVQDLGRFGFQRFGVPVSGALDGPACRTANLLVGNPESAAVLEITFSGLKLEVLAEADLALTGARMPLLVSGRPQEAWESFRVRPGDEVVLKPARQGLRGYLAVGGGFDLSPVMGSRSTYAGARLGGLQGRPLIRGDLLPRGEAPLLAKPKRLPPELRPALDRAVSLRALPGPQDDFFGEGLEVFFSAQFKVSAKADRMGYRLEGPAVSLKEGAPRSIISEPCLAGGVQIPADGQPIILLIEQTVGGYAKIATVITPDLGLVAQARPGDLVRFDKVDLAAARQAARVEAARLARIRELLKS